MVICNHLMHLDYLGEFKGVIFDCDGVIFDSFHANQHYYNLILEKLALGPMTEAQSEYVHTHTVWESLRHIVPQDRHGEIPDAVKLVNYYTDIAPHLVPEPGIYELLTTLRRLRISAAISTNRSTTMERVAAMFGLLPYFCPIITASKVQAKPHPESVHRILRQWRFQKQDVVYIGDSAIDERTARAAGVGFWSYKNPLLDADILITDFWKLRQALIARNLC